MTHGTLLVIEQSANMLRLIRSLVSSQVSRIVECRSGEEALAAYAVTRPDWVLVDISAGAPYGITLTRQIMELFPDAHVTVLADYEDPNIRDATGRAGAKGYLLKENLVSLPSMLPAPDVARDSDHRD
jgi:DNA-binding NarL/FixJ family response regulator